MATVFNISADFGFLARFQLRDGEEVDCKTWPPTSELLYRATFSPRLVPQGPMRKLSFARAESQRVAWRLPRILPRIHKQNETKTRRKQRARMRQWEKGCCTFFASFCGIEVEETLLLRDQSMSRCSALLLRSARTPA